MFNELPLELMTTGLELCRNQDLKSAKRENTSIVVHETGVGRSTNGYISHGCVLGVNIFFGFEISNWGFFGGGLELLWQTFFGWTVWQGVF